MTMNRLTIVWKTDNEIDIHHFVVPYAYNAKRHEWFDEVEIILWGASQEKVAATPLIQQRVLNLIKNGVVIHACKMCATNLDVVASLEALGVNVRFTGDLLSERLKDPTWEVLTL